MKAVFYVLTMSIKDKPNSICDSLENLRCFVKFGISREFLYFTVVPAPDEKKFHVDKYYTKALLTCKVNLETQSLCHVSQFL